MAMPTELRAGVAALASTPAGPRLASLLASLDVSAMTDFECVEVLKARHRQANHDRGELFGVIAEVVRRTNAGTDGVIRQRWPNEFAADEVRAALVLTRNSAQDLCALAKDLVVRLPAVQSALVAGVIDQARARILSDWTLSLSPPHAETVVAQVLPVAPKLTTAQLIKRIATLAMALDPSWTKRQYRQAMQRRRVVGYRTREGTANLSGYDLPTDRVAAACDRLDRLARAAKSAGHADPLDYIRADLFLALINGDYDGMTETQILQHLLAGHTTPDEPASNDGPSIGDQGGGSRDGGGPSDSAPSDSAPGAGGPGGGGSGAGGPGAGGSGAGGSGAGGPGVGGPGGVGSAEVDPQPWNGAGPDGDDRQREPERSGGRIRVGPSGGLRLVVRLATLAGVDRRPGELIGWGPVHASLAQSMALSAGAAWWFVLVDQSGAPLSIGLVRRRPAAGTSVADTDPATATGMCGGGFSGRGLQVWVQVNQATLDALAEQPPTEWTGVITEIRATSQAARGAPNDDPTARLPGKALRRWISMRDRTCVFPGCGTPAPRADADHTIEHANGGPTIDTNLGSTCRHDHRLRHEGKWTVHRSRSGIIVWTSRFGHQYQRQPPPSLDDLPDPIPAAILQPYDERDREFDRLCASTVDSSATSCLEGQPAPETPAPSMPAPAEDDIPPF